VVIRGVYLKGVGLETLWPQMAAMAAFAVLTLTISVFRFRKSME
jgi:ABC-2 type transport system permease protein